MSEIDTAILKDMYTSMLRIRIFEERVAELIEAGDIVCPCHLYIGQEAVAAGVCAALEKEDYVWGGHRSHGHYLAKGGSMNTLMAEMFGKLAGCSGGRGGPCTSMLQTWESWARSQSSERPFPWP